MSNESVLIHRGVECSDRTGALVDKNTNKLEFRRVSSFIKRRTAIKLFAKFPYLRKEKLWGNHFRQRGYIVDSVVANESIIHRHVRHQEKQPKNKIPPDWNKYSK
ncbi:hypothetical protein ATN88_16105 [Enterovibrio coralii]|uniref:Transposase IS200-like domain-containing protein n=1 Tax=Enterovibrio coralii TaxID=294935 RepID=A0A135I5S2_9GAMM|nr:hypothetical protein ATN88_16105 [Enterovibrio coralii]